MSAILGRIHQRNLPPNLLGYVLGEPDLGAPSVINGTPTEPVHMAFPNPHDLPGNDGVDLTVVFTGQDLAVSKIVPAVK